MFEKIERAVERLRRGGLIILVDDDDREAEGDLVGLADLVTAENINFMTKYARGLICAPISKEIAEGLDLSDMLQENTDDLGTAFTVSVDHKTTSTGISAFDRAATIHALVLDNSKAHDFHRPGHIFPLIGKAGGVLERRGHTEGSLDLAALAGSTAAAYICEILKDDGHMARREDLEKLAQEWQMPLISIEELATYLRFQEAVKVSLPTRYGHFDLTLFEDSQGKENLLLSKGDLSQEEAPLFRIHSECATGDIFSSVRCDCGEQLETAMKLIEKEGSGAILYLRQEGRGIGLKNKLRAYQLQDKGFDTYDANIELGFAADERHYDFAKSVLDYLGVEKIRLLTNNPDKVQQLEAADISVTERLPLQIPARQENITYLKTKKEKFQHDIQL
ncbi:bifunctional 3,4-dihydroxy-2-butanone-4-phosphate synthase/GTP cyclohydrolase II [Streptococcus ratti]|uniref:Multifunctional fusion protein n=1 Tax=Streptococcus ratti FA-1 = DSM 20564 TaxID=699248 RepID=A0ABP2QZ84_STRRT|nr:bifunctional 3,4-dihydroxy-2-butanone-4-phosphate synthase/GTP cyclohydrolase II [Streptococcus ratti]EJN94297.1 GTP cyclohydrolase II [Streptococcus ratti FA-1 = DSM 20564]EMP70927.1 GTP cyclohydrolase II [Streptococcus ratti FA-1 = DSM 20564]QEY06250.1 bifunctional 3,4-dihydroxy-2-butanone-4-phosphate synthase/GTP cyclohydrolase II [Streptococcus ratti]VEI60590.1 bifunctional 3,4-dihydroxy-2-butanone 4-phosphate synthase/GTP cyclohydrolase II protein [Streptococcus mutans]